MISKDLVKGPSRLKGKQLDNGDKFKEFDPVNPSCTINHSITLETRPPIDFHWGQQIQIDVHQETQIYLSK